VDSLTFSEDDSFLKRIARRVRPGQIAAAVIIIGFIIGELGKGIGICNLASSCANAPNATELLSQQNSMVYGGAFWQLFTSIFVTDSFPDAAFNAIAVIVLDFFMPDTFDNTRYFAIFFVSALIGNLLTLGLGTFYATAGASGGIFGVFAAAFAYNWAENRKIDIATLVLFLTVFIGSSFIVANVNWIAHLGGSLGGFLAGPLLYTSAVRSKNQYGIATHSSRYTKVIVLGAILLAFVGSAIQFLLFVS
jgi:rhomboid protease GluP